MFTPHPTMSSDEIRERTQRVWDRFYNWRAIWQRSACTPNFSARIAFIFLSKLYRQMYAGTGIPPTVREERNRRRGHGGRPASARNYSGPNRCRSCSRGPGDWAGTALDRPRLRALRSRRGQGPFWCFLRIDHSLRPFARSSHPSLIVTNGRPLVPEHRRRSWHPASCEMNSWMHGKLAVQTIDVGFTIVGQDCRHAVWNGCRLGIASDFSSRLRHSQAFATDEPSQLRNRKDRSRDECPPETSHK